MNNSFNKLLISSLLLSTFFTSYAENIPGESNASNDAIKGTTENGKYVLAPPSPFFTSSVTAADNKPITSELENLVSTESDDTTRRVFELEAALKEHQQKAADLIEELHATAKNSDFENEMYEKTVFKLQQKIDNLDENNKSLRSQLTSMESDTGTQLRLLDTLKQDSVELEALKSAYKTRNDEVEELKKQLADSSKQSSTDTELATLRDAYTAKSEETEKIKAELTTLKDKVKSNQQTEAELAELQNAAAEVNDTKSLLETKVMELEDTNKTLTSQLDKMQQDASHASRKLGLLDQSSAELTSLKSAYKERNNEAITLKGTVQELEGTNKTLLSKVDKFENEEEEQLKKLELMEETNAELITLKSAYKERDDEASTLKGEIEELSNKNKSLLAESETMKAESSHNLRKLNLFDQTSAELTALKSAYKERNDEVALLKEKITELDNNNKTLLSESETMKTDKSQSLRKLNLLDQTTAELTALKSAYKERNDEVSTLKEQLEQEASKHTEKLGLLDQSTTELTSLKSTLKESADKNSSLSEEIENLKGENVTLKSKLTTAQKDAGSQVRKIASLNNTSAELNALKSAYKDRNNENIELKEIIFEANKKLNTIKNEHEDLKNTHKVLSNDNSALTVKLNEQRTLKSSLETSKQALEKLQAQLNESENSKKTLSSQIQTLKTSSAEQKRKLTNLSVITKELAAIKSAYNDLKKEKMAISKELQTATADSDNDGVVNKLDKCPSSKQDSSVDRNGCLEIADADGDKVADANDLCPNTPTNTAVNNFGCVANQSITLEGVNFNVGSDQLTKSSLPIINAAALTLTQNPTINVEVAGYTDNLGVKSINQKLSQRRANSVAIQLIDQGVDAKRIETKGYGESNPVASNKTEAGRLKNRRVELKIR